MWHPKNIVSAPHTCGKNNILTAIIATWYRYVLYYVFAPAVNWLENVK